jgi:hypothetical protein
MVSRPWDGLVDLVEGAQLEAVTDCGRVAEAKQSPKLERVTAGGVHLGEQAIDARGLGGQAQPPEHLLDVVARDRGESVGGGAA